MKGNEQDCICAKPNGKHSKRCDAYRLSEFGIKMASITIKTMDKENWEKQLDEKFFGGYDREGDIMCESSQISREELYLLIKNAIQQVKDGTSCAKIDAKTIQSIIQDKKI